ncbi:MAG: hypothetical protein UR26_C0002G0085 [candidate division TM6 bacterium GW2011_GWF2_32_72]|nr:MAG: hypothetical protein UR26_C0002G0085 [candidate division TM6 bacterium GW2011_GWF2_32_72]
MCKGCKKLALGALLTVAIAACFYSYMNATKYNKKNISSQTYSSNSTQQSINNNAACYKNRCWKNKCSKCGAQCNCGMKCPCGKKCGACPKNRVKPKQGGYNNDEIFIEENEDAMEQY